VLVVVICCLLWMQPGVLPAAETDPGGPAVVSRIGDGPGICVLLGDGPARSAVSLAQASRWTIYVQLPDEEAVDVARAKADAAGLLGSRVVVDKGPLTRVNLADDLADAVIAPADVPITTADRDRLLRAVRPLGKLVLGDEAITKPYPPEADDWTHPYKGPDNNPQSNDRIARAPYLSQFYSEPWYVPFPEVTVASAGRVFKAFGHVGFKQRDWPWLNTLIAINGYNGTHLWKRPLQPGFNIHRNTMIATPEILYLADSKSCKLLDAATGKLTGEITAPPEATGPVWKWMAIADGTLIALVGEEEIRDPTLRGNRTGAGWPWRPMTAGYDRPDYPWGFGRTLFAVDLATKQVRWIHKEEQPIDGRAVAMHGGRLYYYSHPSFLACLDAKQGKRLWRNAEKELLDAIGPHHRAQTPSIGFSTSSYLKCSEKAIYFAGPQRTRLVAASTEGGHLLWQHGDGNMQLVLRDEGLYAMGRTGPSKLFDPLDGRVLAEINPLRGNCTRATGSIDSVFTRGPRHGGTTRLAVDGNRPQRIALMRPDCHDGVIVSGGRLYWGPWMCDCSLSLVGINCLGPAGDFDFNARAIDDERLESFTDPAAPLNLPSVAPGDWPAYRADNRRGGAVKTAIPEAVQLAWQFTPPAKHDPAAPIAAGGFVWLSGSDGAIRTLDAKSGKLLWQGFTGGPITYPPALSDGRLIVGSGDGRVHALEAVTGKPLWRFTAAPAERKINLYGKLTSTWPVAGGVLVDGDTVYAAAGIASFDGTHVYALDAASGKIRWQNNETGRLAGDDSVTGVSVQGHLLLHKDRLYLAGGNVVSPAMFDVQSGRCLNRLEDEWAKAPRGRELFVLNDNVVAFERLLYSPKRYWVGRYFAKHFLQTDAGDVVVQGISNRVARIDPAKAATGDAQPVWQSGRFAHPTAMAQGTNAVVVAGRLPPSESPRPPYAVVAFSIDDGTPLWTRRLPAAPLPGGIALDAAGRVFITLQDGRTLCLAAE